MTHTVDMPRTNSQVLIHRWEVENMYVGIPDIPLSETHIHVCLFLGWQPWLHRTHRWPHINTNTHTVLLPSEAEITKTGWAALTCSVGSHSGLRCISCLLLTQQQHRQRTHRCCRRNRGMKVGWQKKGCAQSRDWLPYGSLVNSLCSRCLCCNLWHYLAV